jgi:hypothetical protein
MQRKSWIGRITCGARVAAIGFVLVLAGGAAEAQQARELYQVNHYDLTIADAPAFVSIMQAIASAAQQANARDVSWYAYRDGNRIALSFPIANMAVLDDTDRFNRAFRGTAGQGAWTESIAAMNTLPYDITTEVLERLPALSYAPARPVEESVIRVSVTTVAAGKGQDYEALIRDANAVRAQVGYPYRTEIFRTVIGEGRRYIAVTFYDSREAYAGANALSRLLSANAEAQATWSALGVRNRALSVRNTYHDMNIARGMTYTPNPQ